MGAIIITHSFGKVSKGTIIHFLVLKFTMHLSDNVISRVVVKFSRFSLSQYPLRGRGAEENFVASFPLFSNCVITKLLYCENGSSGVALSLLLKMVNQATTITFSCISAIIVTAFDLL